jgi:hypothetical protein
MRGWKTANRASSATVTAVASLARTPNQRALSILSGSLFMHPLLNDHWLLEP